MHTLTHLRLGPYGVRMRMRQLPSSGEYGQSRCQGFAVSHAQATPTIRFRFFHLIHIRNNSKVIVHMGHGFYSLAWTLASSHSCGRAPGHNNTCANRGSSPPSWRCASLPCPVPLTYNDPHHAGYVKEDCVQFSGNMTCKSGTQDTMCS
jgi:hypothetical protein